MTVITLNPDDIALFRAAMALFGRAFDDAHSYQGAPQFPSPRLRGEGGPQDRMRGRNSVRAHNSFQMPLTLALSP
jgi:hypothetical protein